jgi:hypothetical protein
MRHVGGTNHSGTDSLPTNTSGISDAREALRWGEREQDHWLERWIRST